VQIKTALRGMRFRQLWEVVLDYSWRLNTRQDFNEFFPFLLSVGKPKVVVEIGTAGGGTLFMFHQIAHPDATIISIDLPFGAFGAGYPPWKKVLFKAFKGGKQKQYLLRKDSHKQSTIKKVKKLLNGREIDVLFVDGDHTYQGVSQDYMNYNPFVRNGGIIAFHDICEHPDQRYGVNKFWNEIKHKCVFREYIGGGIGIGVVCKYC